MRRPAYTLLELMIALGSASVLMAGLSSALFIAAQGLNLDQGASASRGRADAVMGRVLADARTATRFRSVTPTAIELDVADRTGDSAADRLRYEWSGVVGDPLTRTLNGGAAVTLLRDVRALSFESTVQGRSVQNVTTSALHTWPRVSSQSDPTTIIAGSSLAIATPFKVVPGDLLIAIIASTGDQDPVPEAGWAELCVAKNGNNSKIRLSAWRRSASAGESTMHTWNLSDVVDAIGGMIVVSNQDASEAIVAEKTDSQVSLNPTCPSAVVSRPDSLVIRLGGFAMDSIQTPDVVGLSGHTTIWARNVSHRLAAGWGYEIQASAGTTGAANFALRNATESATITLVISPRFLVGQ